MCEYENWLNQEPETAKERHNQVSRWIENLLGPEDDESKCSSDSSLSSSNVADRIVRDHNLSSDTDYVRGLVREGVRLTTITRTQNWRPGHWKTAAALADEMNSFAKTTGHSLRFTTKDARSMREKVKALARKEDSPPILKMFDNIDGMVRTETSRSAPYLDQQY